MCRKAGFTLIELLIVIVIMALLMGLLFPVVRIALELSERVKCANNLGQIGKAVQISTHEFDGYYPDDFHWAGSVSPFVHHIYGIAMQDVGIYLCPGDEVPANGDTRDREGNVRHYLVSYMMNGLFVDRGRTALGQAGGKAADIVLMCDGGNDNLWSPEQIDWDWDHNEDFSGGRIEVHHRNGDNFLFADGHVEFRELDDMPDPETAWSIEPLSMGP